MKQIESKNVVAACGDGIGVRVYPLRNFDCKWGKHCRDVSRFLFVSSLPGSSQPSDLK